MLDDSTKIADIARAEAPDTAQIESEIRHELDEWIEAVNSGFADSIGALYTPGAVLLPTFDPKVLTTAAARNTYFINFKTRRGLQAAVDECHIEVLGNGAGTANGLYTFRFLADDGTPQTVKARFTFVFARQPEGDWLIVAHHSSVAPG